MVDEIMCVMTGEIMGVMALVMVEMMGEVMDGICVGCHANPTQHPMYIPHKAHIIGHIVSSTVFPHKFYILPT